MNETCGETYYPFTVGCPYGGTCLDGACVCGLGFGFRGDLSFDEPGKHCNIPLSILDQVNFYSFYGSIIVNLVHVGATVREWFLGAPFRRKRRVSVLQDDLMRLHCSGCIADAFVFMIIAVRFFGNTWYVGGNVVASVLFCVAVSVYMNHCDHVLCYFMKISTKSLDINIDAMLQKGFRARRLVAVTHVLSTYGPVIGLHFVKPGSRASLSLRRLFCIGWALYGVVFGKYLVWFLGEVEQSLLDGQELAGNMNVNQRLESLRIRIKRLRVTIIIVLAQMVALSLSVAFIPYLSTLIPIMNGWLMLASICASFIGTLTFVKPRKSYVTVRVSSLDGDGPYNVGTIKTSSLTSNN